MPPTYVRPQTFTVLQQPDSEGPAVRFGLKLPFYLLLGHFTYASFSTQNPIYPVFKVHRTYCLVFAFQYKVIISCLKLLLCKASIKISRVYCQQESSNTLPCFSEGLRAEFISAL